MPTTQVAPLISHEPQKLLEPSPRSVGKTPLRPRHQDVPLGARSEEPPRLVTVTNGQTIEVLAGSSLSRWQANSAIKFPS